MPEEREARELLERLPDTYSKQAGSKLFRFFRVIGAEFAAVRDAILQTERYRDIDQATGRTLDYIGSNVGQDRGRVSDPQYRAMIKGRIARNLSPGDVDSIKHIVAAMLSVDVAEVTATPYWDRAESEPAAVEIHAPLAALAQYELIPSHWAKIMQMIVAAGVRASALFRGTFRFSSMPDQSEFDSSTGFSDVDQTTGGTLGAWYDVPAPPLPIGE